MRPERGLAVDATPLLGEHIGDTSAASNGRMRMRMTSGRHKGETLELIALVAPDFIRDLLSSEPRSVKQRRVQAEARRLVDAFNRRAFCVPCVGRDCGRLASRCTICKSDVLNPWWWCDACDPRQYGVGQDRIQIVRTYQDVLAFSAAFDDPNVTRDLILTLAEAKGLLVPSRLREVQADIFFNG